MQAESKVIISFVFKRSGKEKLKKPDFYLTLSMDLKWFKPQDAKGFLKYSVDNGLLISENDLISPSFDINSIEIPTGFKPSNKFNMLHEQEKSDNAKYPDIFESIIDKILIDSDLDKDKVLLEINEVSKKKMVSKHIAALLLCRSYDIDCSTFYEDVEKSIMS